jgi:hypothetical protein
VDPDGQRRPDHWQISYITPHGRVAHTDTYRDIELALAAMGRPVRPGEPEPTPWTVYDDGSDRRGLHPAAAAAETGAQE